MNLPYAEKLQIDCLSRLFDRKTECYKFFWFQAIMSKIEDDCYEMEFEELVDAMISIDHFVPWSYVAHDELWNLHPTTCTINSSKSNHLPDWDTYFDRFARLKFLSYSLWNA